MRGTTEDPCELQLATEDARADLEQVSPRRQRATDAGLTGGVAHRARPVGPAPALELTEVVERDLGLRERLEALRDRWIPPQVAEQPIADPVARDCAQLLLDGE